MPEWTEFSVGEPYPYANDCRQFKVITHTTHIDTALSIIKNNGIRPSLIFDECRLNYQRVLVSWLSPNHWTPGYRYGNIQFEFPFRKLVHAKRFYWVEAIAYNTRACRILVTDLDRSSELEVYDPTAGNGPWWYDAANDVDYFNSNYCLEFMFESQIDLADATQLNFVKHHENQCANAKRDPYPCPEKGMRDLMGGSYFLTRAIATGLKIGDWPQLFYIEGRRLNPYIQMAFREFIQAIPVRNFSGPLHSTSPEAEPIAKSLASAYTFGHNVAPLANLFSSEENMIEATAVQFAKTLRCNDWRKIAAEFLDYQ